MIIGFKTQFVQSILEGTKIHTIREDKHNRWHHGLTMHMATGVRTKNYNCFLIDYCIGIQQIEIYPDEKIITIVSGLNYKKSYVGDAAEHIAINDGFISLKHFYEWFYRPFKGKIIHWTSLLY